MADVGNIHEDLWPWRGKNMFHLSICSSSHGVAWTFSRDNARTLAKLYRRCLVKTTFFCLGSKASRLTRVSSGGGFVDANNVSSWLCCRRLISEGGHFYGLCILLRSKISGLFVYTKLERCERTLYKQYRWQWHRYSFGISIFTIKITLFFDLGFVGMYLDPSISPSYFNKLQRIIFSSALS